MEVLHFASFSISQGIAEVCLLQTADASTTVFTTKYQYCGMPQTAKCSQVKIPGDAQILEDEMLSTLPDNQE